MYTPAYNKSILEKANAAIVAGDNEGFLAECTDDTTWVFVGERTLRGKEAVRQYMAANYVTPPSFVVENLIAEDAYVVAMGTIYLEDKAGDLSAHSYCDVWRFSNGKIAELKAFVIRNPI